MTIKERVYRRRGEFKGKIIKIEEEKENGR